MNHPGLPEIRNEPYYDTVMESWIVKVEYDGSPSTHEVFFNDYMEAYYFWHFKEEDYLMQGGYRY